MSSAGWSRGAVLAGRALLWGGLGVVVLIGSAWCFGALYYSNLPLAWLRALLAWAFLLGTLAAFLLLPRRRRTLLAWAGVFALVAAWYLLIPASNDRDWALDVSRLPRADFEGGRVTISGLRDFAYAPGGAVNVERVAAARWVERTYDLARLDGVDLVLSYWDGNRDIAHMILSFGFDGGERVAVSIETRRERHEGYSATAGFFKQFELIYVAATERDLLRLRTDYRGEDVYLYPSRLDREEARALFDAVFSRANSLHDEPRFYNALWHNCTTAWLAVSEDIRRDPLEFDLRLLRNGYYDELTYERGRIVADVTAGQPYDQMRRAHRITELVQQLGELDDAEFSRQLRAAMPQRTPVGG